MLFPLLLSCSCMFSIQKSRSFSTPHQASTLQPLKNARVHNSSSALDLAITEELTAELNLNSDKPWLLRGGCKDWEAYRKWNVTTLLKQFKGTYTTDASYLDSNPAIEDDYLDGVHETFNGKFESNMLRRLSVFVKSVSQSNQTVHFFEALQTTVQTHDWRFFIIGPKGNGIQLHIDFYNTSFWNALIRGRKRWIFLPENTLLQLAEKGMPVAHWEHISAAHFFSGYYDKVAAAGVKFYEVLQEAGDIVFGPAGMAHVVHTLEDAVTVSEQVLTSTNFVSYFRAFRYPGYGLSQVLYSDLDSDSISFDCTWVEGMKLKLRLVETFRGEVLSLVARNLLSCLGVKQLFPQYLEATGCDMQGPLCVSAAVFLTEVWGNELHLMADVIRAAPSWLLNPF